MKSQGFICCHNDSENLRSDGGAGVGNIKNFAIEDVLHIGPNCKISAKKGCQVADLTGR